MKSYRSFRPLSLLLLLLAILLVVRPASAHGGDGAILRLSNTQAGPFNLNVWTYPSLLLPGTVHFSVSVLDNDSGDPMPATAVLVQVTPLDEENQTAPINSRAMLDFQSLLHETYLDIPQPGRYQVTVQVAASTEQQGTATFEIKVVSGTGYRLMIIGFMGITIVSTVWLAREGLRTWGIERWFRRQRKKAERKLVNS
ncbi:MAG: hypothetical protein WAM60_19950 [Candidatus Promineifilaceae bacterium]